MNSRSIKRLYYALVEEGRLVSIYDFVISVSIELIDSKKVVNNNLLIQLGKAVCKKWNRVILEDEILKVWVEEVSNIELNILISDIDKSKEEQLLRTLKNDNDIRKSFFKLFSIENQITWNGNSKLNKNYKGCNLNSVGVK